MADDEKTVVPADDEGDKTVVVDREADKTVVVDRRKAADEAPEPDDEDARTVVVDRRARPSRTAKPPVPLDSDPADDDAEDRTVVVDRDEDRTVVVDREADKTVVVDRKRRGKRASDATTDKPGAAPGADSVINLLPTRRGIKTAPVDPATVRAPVEAVGPNVVETYVPREIAPLPEAAPAVPRGEEALRAPAPSMPSVSRSSRKAGALALLVFAGACVVSVIGIIAVVVWFVRS